MDARQKTWALFIVGLVTIASMIPAVWFLAYGERLLPVLEFNIKLKKPQRPILQIPFAIRTGPDNIVTSEVIKELPEGERVLLTRALEWLFHIRINNLAYYFEYFTIVGSYDGAKNVSAVVSVFSHEPPTVNVDNGIKKVGWVGQLIGFDNTGDEIIYAVDKVLQFDGQTRLAVRVFYSNSLESGKVDQPVDPRKIIPSEKF